METYNNDYTQQEDFTLWELHEIRHRLYLELQRKSVAEINADARKKYLTWQNTQKDSLVTLEYPVE
jgi:hypothetical protein